MADETGGLGVGTEQPGGSAAYVWLLASVAALGGLLFGYDTAVIAGAIDFLEARFQLDEYWKGWAVSNVLVGCMIGAAAAGPLSDRFGRKKVLVLSAVLFAVSAVASALPRNLTELVLARFLGGLGVGMASMLSPLYIAEVSPARLRGRLVSLNQITIISGMLVIAVVNWLIARPAPTADQIRLLLDQRTGDELASTEGGPDLKKKRAAALETVDHEGLAAVREAFPDVKFVRPETDQERKRKADEDKGIMMAYLRPTWNGQHGWRWMFGSETLPAMLFLACLFLVPESPRWLTKQGREGEAMAVLARVGGAQQAERQMAEIKEAIAQESGSFWELFHPGMRVALGIAVVLAVLQQVTGINAVMYYAPGIFLSSGAEVSATRALLQTVAVQAVNLLFTLVAIRVVDQWGRRPLMLVTSAAMGVTLVLLGLSFQMELPPGWVFAFVLAYVASFAVAMGPVVWVVLAEIFPTRTRGRAMAVATVALWIACFAVSQSVPWMFKHMGHATTFWTYAVMCCVSFVFVQRFVPETKGKTLEEIERSWVKGE